MLKAVNLLCIGYLFTTPFTWGQDKIGNFLSVEPMTQTSDFIIPSTHVFQKIIEEGDPLTAGDALPGNVDFTGYVPINGSSENGHLSINSELHIGGVTILDIYFNSITKNWETLYSQKVDFTGVGGTSRNCSGTVTPWGTIISCEETVTSQDANMDAYHDFGWCVEIDPKTKTVIDKRWAMGKFKHENVAIAADRRTVYQGADSYPGYLFRFVADSAEDLSSGKLYVYGGKKFGTGHWIELYNETPFGLNGTLTQCDTLNATVFNGIEDVEIGPDGQVYFAVKGENRVFRFRDGDPLNDNLVLQMETYVGAQTYEIKHEKGVSKVDWGSGNDNLAFDDDGNLWVFQDDGNRYIWVVGKNHTQMQPDVRIFGRTPAGAEPTGITFSPDYRFLFMSLQHPYTTNKKTSQRDAAGELISFDKDISLVIALKDNLGIAVINPHILLYPNPFNTKVNISFNTKLPQVEIRVHNLSGQLILTQSAVQATEIDIDLSDHAEGVYLVNILSEGQTLAIHKLIKQ